MFICIHKNHILQSTIHLFNNEHCEPILIQKNKIVTIAIRNGQDTSIHSNITKFNSSSLKSTSQIQSWCHLQQNTESRNTIHIFTQILKYHVFNIYTKSTKRSAHFFFSFSEGNLLKSCNNLHKHTLVSKQK